MKSLFMRVLISFWVVLGIIAGGSILTTVMVARHRIAVLNSIDFEQMNTAAVTALHKDGENGLRTWLRDVSSAYPGVDIYLLDRAGKDLLNRPVPVRLEQWLARGNGQALIAGAPGENPLLPSFQFAGSHLLDSSQISARDGANYTLAVAWFGSSPVDVLGSYDIAPGLLILALVASFGASWLLARYISAPIRELQQRARILARGDLDSQVADRFSQRQDEIGTLARDFNHMAAELKSQIQAKEILLRDVSHELRSPLARIQIALGLAALDNANIEIQHQRIERDIERMNRLIEEIIRLAKLTSAYDSFPMEEFDLGVLLAETVEDVTPEAAVAGRRLMLSGTPGLLVRGNPELLRRAVENILRNAIRFSPENGDIEILAMPVSGELVVRIGDHGPGVPEQDLQRIFDPFYRVSTARERDRGGTGLGLAIAARVMAMHGGNVSACNRQGGGLIVTLAVPAHAASQPPDEMAAATEAMG